MSKGIVERRINAILFLMAAWLAAVAVSLWAILLRVAPDTGLGNTDVALGWQGIAGLLAFAIFGIGLGLPARHGVRRISIMPLSVAGIVVAWLVAGQLGLL